MRPVNLPEADLLKYLFDYDEVEGKLRRKTGQIVGDSAGRSGYCQVTVCGNRLQTHRVMWKIATGEDPDEIDHINGIKVDNRLVNLRSVTRSQNQFNAKTRKDSSSGVKGLSFLKRERKWRVLVTANKVRHEKMFPSLTEARGYLKALRSRLHGEFASH